MQLDVPKKAYEDLSAKVSDIVRQLSLAGIGLIWVFRANDGRSPVIPVELLRSALFIVAALALDLLQYVVGTITWYLFFRKHEKAAEAEGPLQVPPSISDAGELEEGGTLEQRAEDEEEFSAPAWINVPTWTLFALKTIAMVAAYIVYILPFLFSRFTER